jgi:NADH-quinone oxidoreductase subunit G
MPTISIDGKICEFEGSQTILQVALANGVDIPHYCYHPGMSIVASCRICLAEVAQPDPRKDGALSLIPKLLPTCQTPAVDGAEVYTKSDKAQANQKAVMEYLLINHPLDCPVCDQAGECYLQDYSYDYGRGYSRFEEDKQKNPKKDIGPHVLLYADRCIMCTRCVRFTREVTGTDELCVVGRGHKEEIDVFPGKALDNPLSGNVVDICPVGALLDKDFLMSQRVWYLTSTPSIDGITASGDNIHVDHNDGKVWRIKPRVNPRVNQWWISDEIRYGWRFVHSERRLTTPTVRTDAGPTGRTWNHALAHAAKMLRGRRTAVMISPMLSCEDVYELAAAIRSIDGQAAVGIGPVPVHGEDRTFPGGYTIRAEKAPNARGVRQAIERATGADALTCDRFAAKLADAQAVVLTGNYPGEWITDDLARAIAGRFTVLIDTLAGKLTETADVVLPAATWVEKAGTFVNVDDRLQAFGQAIAPIDFARPEGQIAIDLAAAAGAADPRRFNPDLTRERMGGRFLTDVHYPAAKDVRASDMQFVEI